MIIVAISFIDELPHHDQRQQGGSSGNATDIMYIFDP
jgi:hypothetical protein